MRKLLKDVLPQSMVISLSCSCWEIGNQRIPLNQKQTLLLSTLLLSILKTEIKSLEYLEALHLDFEIKLSEPIMYQV